MDTYITDADDFREEDAGANFSGDLCEAIMSRYKNSTHEDHQHLCAVAGAISQELLDQNLPLSPVSYFGAAASALERLADSHSSLDSGDPAVAALLNLLHLSLSGVSSEILKSKGLAVADVVVRLCGMKSQSPAPVKAGLKCVSYILGQVDKSAWPAISRPYGFILGYVIDQRPKVRRQAHLCLQNCLKGFETSAVLVPASEGIANIFERCLLLASGSRTAGTNAPEGTKGAVEVLYILNALKDCLWLMSTKASSSIVKYFKTLVELEQPIVTRNIMNILYALCSTPTSEIVPEVLQDLLCSLSLSISAEGKSVEDMILRARVIHVMTKKVYSLNRDVCVVKLPIIFSALGDLLACKHAEAIFAAAAAMKDLIEACIDDVLIKQGVSQIQMDLNGGTRNSAPTIIEKLCASLESLIGYQYNAVWDMSFQIITVMFNRLGDSSSYLMRGILKSLAEIQKLPDEDLSLRKELHKCIGSALGAMGPESFLSLLPLKLDAEDMSQIEVWLLPILKQHTVGGSLSFFIKTILNSALELKQKSKMLVEGGLVVSSRNATALVYSLWSLLPAFCNYPIDTADSFGSLAKPMVEALHKEPELQGIICSSLQILIQQNKAAVTGNISNFDGESHERSVSLQRARNNCTHEVAANNLKVLSSFSQKFLSVLFKIFEESQKDSGGWLQSTIAEVASISDKKVVKRFFKAAMLKLLEVTQKVNEQSQAAESSLMQIDESTNNDDTTIARAGLLDLAASLLRALDAESIDLLYLAVKPALQWTCFDRLDQLAYFEIDGYLDQVTGYVEQIQEKNGLVQKKAYKVLSSILREREEFLLGKADEILELMIQVLPDCHFSAKRHRLESLYLLIVHCSKNSSEEKRRDILGSYLTEIILSLKETNAKTRNRVYDLLVKIGHACGDPEQGGTRDNLLQFFNMVVGCLAGKTPQMISAAVKGLARLAYEFSDLVTAVSNLLPSAFLLLQSKNREIIKADLGLMKVLVAKLQPEGLQMHLKSMVEGLLHWKDDTKNHFKAKFSDIRLLGNMSRSCLEISPIMMAAMSRTWYPFLTCGWIVVLSSQLKYEVKFLLEMLVRRCGVDAVRAVMPKEHMKLLNNIRKTKERKERSRAAKSAVDAKSLNSRASTARLSRWSHTNIFSDVGDEDSDVNDETMDGRTAASRRSSRAMSGVTSKAASKRYVRACQSDKMLPQDSLDRSENDDPLDLLDQQKTKSSLRSLNGRKRKSDKHEEPEFAPDGRLVIKIDEIVKNHKEPDPDDEMETKSQKSRHSVKSQSSARGKRQKTNSGWAYTGKEYASRKASGDVKKKNKLEPYAYWPLDRKLLNRREENKATARKGLGSVVRMTKKLEGKSVASALSDGGFRPKKHKGHKGKAGKSSR